MNYALKGLVLLEPYFYVVQKTDPNVENVDVGDQIAMVREKENSNLKILKLQFTNPKALYEVPTAEIFESIPSGTTITFRDVHKFPNPPPGTGEMILYVRKMKDPDHFFQFWIRLRKMSKFSRREKDDIFHDILIGKKDKDPSLLRRIAKTLIPRPNEVNEPKNLYTFLEYLLEQKKDGKPYLRLTTLLSDPDLYSKKKEGHKMKELVDSLDLDHREVSPGANFIITAHKESKETVLGVELANTKSGQGVLVKDVTPGELADKAGLRKGDVIESI